MKYILIIILFAWLLVLTVAANNLARELTELQASYALHIQKADAQSALNNLKAQAVIDGVRDLLMPFDKIIPVDGGYLAVREE